MFTSIDGTMDLRVAAYAVITDEAGRLLLPHWSEGTQEGWTMPGGGIDPGEHPADAAVREVLEETGYHVELDGLLGVDSFVFAAERVPAADRPRQALRIVYRAHVTGGELRVEQDGSTDGVAWHTPEEVDALDRVALVDLSRRWAGLIP
ncbi:8-oxo-dGTP pyrophosphatase MutT (NUDIX family) [Promicromonospora sukumoe]|uniref:8-oxo-dGTP pyrophosphatase MutT (NUDIX family) n=2 Tax=Promicromonospora sukumoe TaxID=88382 RepID=A0A7W3J720_9MICO|nr:8-oxo-dGTP pyrophosphatase MutT (NUDIX family) [Promicromonospora sukumoe]